MPNELKPCPFCQSKDVHITNAFPHYVYCLNCHVMLQLAGHTYEKDIPKIVEAWNRRIDNGKKKDDEHSGFTTATYENDNLLTGW